MIKQIAGISLLFSCLLPGCFSEELFSDDLERGRQAVIDREWPLAERLLERFLREERDSEKRWQAWNLMLEAINATRREPRASLDCLEVMLIEYEENESRLEVILALIGEHNHTLRHYDRAANAWNAYTELRELSPDQLVNGYRQLAKNQLGQRHFDAAEETLQQCLALPEEDHVKIWCMLDLADCNMGRQRWQEVADLCQQILDAEPEEEILGIAAYMRADALEQLGHPEEALKQFEAARDLYPNPDVMDNRIAFLKESLKAKK